MCAVDPIEYCYSPCPLKRCMWLSKVQNIGLAYTPTGGFEGIKIKLWKGAKCGRTLFDVTWAPVTSRQSARKTSWLFCPLNTSWCWLSLLSPPPPATTTASPRGAAQMLAWGSSFTWAEFNLTTKAEAWAPISRSVFSLPLLIASLSWFRRHLSRAKCMQWCLQAVFLKSVQCTNLFLPAYFYFLVSKIKL